MRRISIGKMHIPEMDDIGIRIFLAPHVLPGGQNQSSPMGPGEPAVFPRPDGRSPQRQGVRCPLNDNDFMPFAQEPLDQPLPDDIQPRQTEWGKTESDKYDLHSTIRSTTVESALVITASLQQA